MKQLERKPIVAGSFYPADRASLHDLIRDLEASAGPGVTRGVNTRGIIVPHAGYVYSGKTAMMSYRNIDVRDGDRLILIGPNHESFPAHTSVFPSGLWRTPLGAIRVDEEICSSIVSSGSDIVADPEAHGVEHSLEVQLPMLQYLFGENFRICPIIMGDQGRDQATKLARALLTLKEDFLLVISSDFTHYEPLASANRKDMLLVDAIETLDVEAFYSTLYRNHITACGYGPIAVLMEYARAKGGRIDLVHHTTSYDFSGDSSNVVGYCSLTAEW